MKKTLKWSLIAVAGVLTLVVGTVLAHPMWLPSVASHFASKALGKPVSIRALSFSYSLPITVSLGGLDVPGFVKLDTLEATADPLAAMDGRFMVPDVLVKGLSVTLPVPPLPGATDTGTLPAKISTPKLPALPLSLVRMKFEDVNVTSPGGSASLASLSMAVDTTVEGSAILAVEAGGITATDPAGRHWPLASLKLKADTQLGGETAEIRNLSIDSPGLTFHATGKASALFSELPTVNLTTDGKLDFAEVNAALATAKLTLPVSATGQLTHAMNISTTALGDLTISIQLDPKGLNVKDGQRALLTLPDQPLTLSGGCSLKGGKVGRPRLAALSVPWEFLKVKGENIEVPSLMASGGTKDLTTFMNLNGQMSFSTDLQKVVSEYAPFLKGMADASGKIEAELKLVGDGKSQRLDIVSKGAEISLTQGGQTYSENRLDNSFSATLKGEGEVHVLEFEDSLSLEGLGAKGTLKGRITNLDAVLAGRLQDSPDNALMADFAADLKKLDNYGVKGLQGAAQVHLEAGGTAGKGDFKLGVDVKDLKHVALVSPADFHVALEGQSRMEGEHLTVTELQRLQVQGPGGLDVGGALKVECPLPAKLESIKAAVDLKGTLPSQAWLASQLPGKIPPALSFGVPVFGLTVQHGSLCNVGMELGVPALAWSDAFFNYSAPLEKVTLTAKVDPATRELKEARISYAWGPLVSGTVTAKGKDTSWLVNAETKLDLSVARNALVMKGIEDIKIGAGSSLDVKVDAKGDPKGVAVSGSVAGPLKVTHPMFTLDEPLMLAFDALQTTNNGASLFSMNSLDLTLGNAASPVATVHAKNFKPAPAGGLLPLPFEGSLEARLGSEGLLRVGGEKARAALGKLELSGDIDLRASKSATPDDLNVSCQLKDSKIYLGDLVHKDVGVPLGLSFAAKTGAFGIDLGGQSLKGMVDLQGAKANLSNWHLELAPLTGLFPMLVTYSPKGAIDFNLQANGPDVLLKLKAPRAEGEPAPAMTELVPLAEITGSLGFRGVFAQLPGPKSSLPVKLDGELSWKKPKGEALPSGSLKSFSLGAGRTDLTLEGSITAQGDLLAAKLTGKGALVDLDELQAHFKPPTEPVDPAKEKPKPEENVKAVPTPLPTLDEGALAKLLEGKSVQADLTLAKVLASKIEVENAKLVFSFKAGVATLEELSGKVSQGTVMATARKSFVGTRELVFKADVKDLLLTQELVSQGAEGSWILALVRDLVYKLVPGVTGIMGGKIDIQSRGINPPELIEAIKGNVDFLVKDATVSNPAHFVKIGSILRGAATALAISKPDKAKQLQKVGDLLANPKYDTVSLKTVLGDQTAEIAVDLISSQGHPGLKVRGKVFLDSVNPAASKCRFVVIPTELSQTDQANVTEICQMAYGEDGFVLGDSLDKLGIEFDMKVVAKLAAGSLLKDKLGEKVPGAGDVIEGLGDLFKKKEKPPEDDEYDEE